MNTNRFTNSSRLLGCYFHQDWTDEFEDDTQVLQAISQAEPPEQVQASIREINRLIAEHRSEGELRVILIDDIGCYFEPDSQGITYVDWLLRVREAFSKST